MAYLELEQIEAAAWKLRKRLGVEALTHLDMMTVIVKAKHHGLIKNYRRVPDHEMPDDEAAFDPYERVLLIRESTFSAMNRDDPRARFTIAHEMGHMALAHKHTRHRNASGRRIEKIAPTIKRDEAQADKFAGAFLAPACLVDEPLTTPAKDLADRFGLSSSAAEKRKPELETMYRRTHGIERPLPESLINYLRDAEKKGHVVKSLKQDRKR